jgi:hypothetical protein
MSSCCRRAAAARKHAFARLAPVLALTLGGMERSREADGDWAAVADAISGRLVQLRMTQMDAASRARISLTTLRELQNNTSPRRRRPQTLAALSVALGWPPEYLSAILRGDKSQAQPPGGGTADRTLLVMESIEQELRDLRQRVTSIERQLAGEEA